MRRSQPPRWILGSCLLAASSLWAVRGWAKDPHEGEPVMTDDEMGVRTEGAHRFLLPKDWPVERRDGHLSPITVEAYLSMKFSQVKRKFSETDQRLDELERRLAALEQDNKQLLRWMRLMEERQQAAQPKEEVTHGDTTQIPEAESPEAPNTP